MREGATRRGFLLGTGGLLAARTIPALGRAQTETRTATSGPDFGGWLANTGGGFRDATGTDRVVVEIGSESGEFGFFPAGLAISPGTTVVWKWVTDSHSIAVHSQPDGADWSGHEQISNAGTTHEHTFDTRGTYLYYCRPHRSLGAKGGILVGEPGTPIPTPEKRVSGPRLPWLDDAPNYGGQVADRRGQSSATVDVGVRTEWDVPVASPAAVWVDPGTEVTFRWRTGGHELTVDSHPEETDWTGHPSAESAGFTYSHTFDAGGVYRYQAGSNGVVLVGENPAAPDDPTGGASFAWEYTAGAGADLDVWTHGDENLYLTTASDSAVVAIDRETGQKRWRTPFSGGTFYPVGPRDGSFYVAAGPELVALGESGGRRWAYSLTEAGELPSFPGTVLRDERVFTRVSNHVDAVDDASGSRDWRVTLDGVERASIVSPIRGATNPVRGTLFVTGEPTGDAADDARLYAVDVADGTISWRATLPVGDADALVVDDERAVVGVGMGVYAFDRETGTRRWGYEPSAGQAGIAVPDDARGRLYVHVRGTGGNGTGEIHAIDRASGDRVWRRGVGTLVDPGALIVGENALYVGSTTGLRALDPANGRTRWTSARGEVVYSDVLATNEALVFAAGHDVRAVERDSGRTRWAFDTGHTVQALHLADDGVVALTEHDLLAVALDDGTRRWGVETALDTDLWWLDPRDERYYVGGDTAMFAVEPGSGGLLSALPNDIAGLPTVGVGAGVVATLVAAGAVARYRSGSDADAPATTDSTDAPATTDSPDAVASADSPGAAASADEAGTGPGRESGADAGPDAEADSGPGAGAGADAGPASRPASDRRADSERGQADSERDGAESESGQFDSGVELTGPPDEIPGAPDLSLRHEQFSGDDLVGQGGNADVYRETVTVDGTDVVVAVKKPRVAGTMHAEVAERFSREAETWARLDDHEHVVDVVDYGDSPMPWIAMEYMDGGHLGERAGDLPLDQALWTALSITRAVRHAHTHGVVHRDLSPGNVLFRTVDGAWDVPKVADWGLAKVLLNHSRTVEGVSPHYAAPEQFDEEHGETDHRTDIYQLGAVCYELFTGEQVFEGSTTRVVSKVLREEPTPPTDREPTLPDRLDDVLGRALAKDRADRYEDVLLMRDDLRDIYETV